MQIGLGISLTSTAATGGASILRPTFNGTNSRVDTPIKLNATALQGYNIQGSFNASSTGSGSTRLILDARDAGNVGLFLQLSSAGVLQAKHNAGTSISVSTGLYDDTDHTFEVDWDGATLTLTLDGTTSSNTAIATPMATTTNIRWGGRSFSTIVLFFKGKIWGVTLVNGTAGNNATWNADEGTGTNIADSSGNGHDATLVNGTWS